MIWTMKCPIGAIPTLRGAERERVGPTLGTTEREIRSWLNLSASNLCVHNLQIRTTKCSIGATNRPIWTMKFPIRTMKVPIRTMKVPIRTMKFPMLTMPTLSAAERERVG